jgi:hypothetical protein
MRVGTREGREIMAQLTVKDDMGLVPANHCRDLIVFLGPSSRSDTSDVFGVLPRTCFRTLQRLEPLLKRGAHLRLDVGDLFSAQEHQIKNGIGRFWSVLVSLYRKKLQVSVAIMLLKCGGQKVEWTYVPKGLPKYDLDDYYGVYGQEFRNIAAHQRWLEKDFAVKIALVSPMTEKWLVMTSLRCVRSISEFPSEPQATAEIHRVT